MNVFCCVPDLPIRIVLASPVTPGGTNIDVVIASSQIDTGATAQGDVVITSGEIQTGI